MNMYMWVSPKGFVSFCGIEIIPYIELQIRTMCIPRPIMVPNKYWVSIFIAAVSGGLFLFLFVQNLAESLKNVGAQ